MYHTKSFSLSIKKKKKKKKKRKWEDSQLVQHYYDLLLSFIPEDHLSNIFFSHGKKYFLDVVKMFG